MTIKKFIKIKNTLGVYTISDWVPIKQEKNSKCLVLNNKNISNNWFLLGIRHSETDKKVYGYLKINNSYFFQGRELGSTRLRWRIIHISKAGLIKLYLENIMSWWKKKAGKRYDKLKAEGRFRDKVELWTEDDNIQIIR